MTKAPGCQRKRTLLNLVPEMLVGVHSDQIAAGAMSERSALQIFPASRQAQSLRLS